MHHKSTPAVGPLPGWTAPARALLVAFCLLMLAVGPSLAIELFPPESEFRGNFNTTLSIGAAMRVADQDPQLIGVTNGGEAYSINGDNGNLNYENGDVVSATAKATHELSLRYRNLSAFARGFYFYDAAIMNMETARTEMSSDAEDEIGRDFTLLDAYLAVDVPLGGMGFTLRGGNQVLSWGEGTVIQNGINTISPIDVSKLRVAGAELREGLTAVPMIDVNLGLGERFSVEGFYELMWDHTEIEPEGTFFSTNDFASPGGEYLFLGFGVDTLVSDNPPSVGIRPDGKAIGSAVPRMDDREAEDDGQFGIALRWFEPWLNDTEFGFYFTRLHSRLPLLSAFTGKLQEGLLVGNYAASAGYFREFPEDIDTYGFSFNTDLGFIGTAMQGELAYHADQPLQIDGVELVFAALSPLDPYLVPGVPTAVLFGNGQLGSFGFEEEITGFRRKDVMQAQMTLTKAVGPRLLADQVIFLGEFGGTVIQDMEDEEEFRYESPGTNTSGNAFFTDPSLPTDPPIPLPKVQPATQEGGFPTDVSWGYRLIVRADFNNAIGPINLRPGLAFEHDVSGTTPMPLGNFVEGRKSITASLSASLLMAWGAELAYTNSFGADEFNERNDRDFVSFTINYSF
jgi:hypothetical protein